MKKLNCTLLCTLCIWFSAPAAAQQPMDKMWGDARSIAGQSDSGERGRLFEWGNYAMFVHWGLYSHLGNVWNGKTYYGIGEWMMNEGMAMPTATNTWPRHGASTPRNSMP